MTTATAWWRSRANRRPRSCPPAPCPDPRPRVGVARVCVDRAGVDRAVPGSAPARRRRPRLRRPRRRRRCAPFNRTGTWGAECSALPAFVEAPATTPGNRTPATRHEARLLQSGQPPKAPSGIRTRWTVLRARIESATPGAGAGDGDRARDMQPGRPGRPSVVAPCSGARAKRIQLSCRHEGRRAPLAVGDDVRRCSSQARHDGQVDCT